MHYSVLSIFLSFAYVIQGQSIDSLIAQLPSCSLSCFKIVYVAAGCKPKDYSCGCNLRGTSLETSEIQCLRAACISSDLSNLRSLTDKICTLVSAAGASTTGSVLDFTSAIATGVFTGAGSTYTSLSQLSTAGFDTISSSRLVGFQTSFSTATTTDGKSSISSLASSSSSRKSALSTGAAVGLGVGVTLASLGMLIAAIFFCIRYRNRGKAIRQLEASNNMQVGNSEEKAAGVSVQPVQPEIDGKEADAVQKHHDATFLRNQGYGGGGGGMPSELGDQGWGKNGLSELHSGTVYTN